MPTHEMLPRARGDAAACGGNVIDTLAVLAGCCQHCALEALARLLGWPTIAIDGMLPWTPAFDLASLSRAMQKQCVLLRGEAGVLLAVIGDPFDADLQTWAQAQAGGPVYFRLALRTDIQAYLSAQEKSARTMDQLGSAGPSDRRDARTAAVLSFASVSEGDSGAVQLVNSTLYDALKVGASDIHLESTADGLTIRYRIDGVLDHAATFNGGERAEQVVSRLKILAELDIAERRVPQDGSFRVEANGREIDLRLSIMPSIHGEDAVIRVLDKEAMIKTCGTLTLEALGFDAASLSTLRRLAGEPYGMLLVTGPTGSGKTTTLYAALTEIDHGSDKIITIEDPVEYQLPGILQIPVNEKKGLTFARGLRSVLRHDPDKIMVGEIRDRETAEIAVQSALTGHLVLTTVHANNVFDVLGRFTHMGIDPYAFVSALNGIWAQRLIRINCPHCALPHAPGESELALVGLDASMTRDFQFRQGTGCGECRGTAYRGRRSIAEILVLNDEIRELIVERRPLRQIKDAARQAGTRSLRDAALELVRNGETTLAETRRVTMHA